MATALCLAFLAHPAAAQDVSGCNSWPDVPVNLQPVFDEPKTDFSQNLAAIQLIASDRQHSIPQYHAITMGITSYRPVLEFRVPIVVQEEPDGLSCAYVQHVDVTLGYRDVTVFIASEIPQGTCAFDETMAHEQKHIAVNQNILEEFAPLIEERFKAYLKLNGVSRVQNPDYAKQLITERLKSIMDEVVDQMIAENMRRQREVDSTDEYARLSRVCNGELSSIADRYRRLGP